MNKVVCELARYDVVVGTLQKTKWFGSEVYEINESVVLTPGRSKTAEGETIKRGEGVALVFRGLALVAWKRGGGKQWKACSSRAVSACLRLDGSTKGIHVVSCYAPIKATSREDKDAFFKQLDNINSSVPSGKIYILLGDFNARLGSRDSFNDQRGNVRHSHGLGALQIRYKVHHVVHVYDAFEPIVNTW